MKLTDIVRGKGAPFGKLTVYPIKVEHYEDFIENKLCLTLMQKKFGIEMASLPYLRMLLYLSNKQVNLLEMLSKILSLSLHMDEEQIRLQMQENGKVALIFTDSGDENAEIIETISELRFSKLRRLIAELNDIKLPNEQANLEILESEEDIARMNAVDLNVDFKSLFFSVAVSSGLSTEELLNMTIFEFEERISAISRTLKYRM